MCVCVCERALSFIYLFITLILSRTNTEYQNYFMSLQRQMQFDVQRPNRGGKISHLITDTDDRWLRGADRVEVSPECSHNRSDNREQTAITPRFSVSKHYIQRGSEHCESVSNGFFFNL